MTTSEDFKTKGTLFFLYLGKLVEFGLIAGNAKLTTKGFDAAIDAYENGKRISDDEIKGFLKELPNMDEYTMDGLFTMISHLQKIGFEEMKNEVELYKKERYEKETGSI